MLYLILFLFFSKLNLILRWHSVKLYVDILNYASHFFPLSKPFHHLEQALKKVTLFVDAAKKSGYEVVVFIDAVQISDEADNKWKSRREEEVVKGIQNMPQGLEALLADSFRLNTVVCQIKELYILVDRF